MADALCREPAYRELFAKTLDFRNHSAAAAVKAFHAAAEVCARCLVRDECLAEALHWLPDSGCWAGYSVKQLEGLALRYRMEPVGRISPAQWSWTRLTPEERSDRQRRAWATRKRNQALAEAQVGSGTEPSLEGVAAP
jgi:hypothetical protein